MTLVIALLREGRWLLISALIASAVNGLLASRIVALMNRSLDASRGELEALGIQFMLLSVAALSVRWFSLAQFVRLSQATLARLRLGISRQIAALPFRETEARGPARLLAVLTEDVGTVGECFMMLPWLFVHGVVLVGCLGHLLVLSWEAFLFMALVLVLGSIGYARGARNAQAELRRARGEEDALFGHFRALFSGAKELKLHAARRAALLDDLLTESTERVREARSAGLLTHAALANWRLFLLFGVVGGILFAVGPTLGLAGEVQSGYAITLLYMMLPINAVLESVPWLGRMGVALERIEELGLSSAVAGPAQSVQLPRFRSLSLAGVTHRYRREDDERPFVLGPLDLELRPGEVVFLIGGNGSGKTTLAKLLTGLYEPEGGEVRLNGEPVDTSTRASYREHFSTVFSDFHLFDDLAVDGAQMDGTAQELLCQLHLERKLTIVQGALSTTALSSGQRKRLALLLAWLDDRPVYVFDEWAADQDPAYKEVFYRRILPDLKQQGKAVLVITHDDRYFHLADRCLRLEDGKLSVQRAELVRSHVSALAPSAAPSLSKRAAPSASKAWMAGEP